MIKSTEGRTNRSTPRFCAAFVVDHLFLGQAKVGEHNVAIGTNEDILWLEVPTKQPNISRTRRRQRRDTDLWMM